VSLTTGFKCVAKPLIVHIDRLQRYEGALPACWVDTLPTGRQPEDGVGMTASEPLSPAVSGPEGARQPGSRHAATRPAWLQDFICSLAANNMPQCEVCGSSFDTESGLRRHMLVHGLRYHSGGQTELLTSEEVEKQTEQARLSQMNSKRRRRYRARVTTD